MAEPTEPTSPDPVVNDIDEQLRGPDRKGWSQLGKNDKGEDLTLVDAVAKLLADVAAIKAKVGA